MELWISIKHIVTNLKKHFDVENVNIVIQDGEDSGQTVSHCHIHLIPLQKDFKTGKLTDIDNKNSEKRKLEDMEEEALDYRKNFYYP